MKQSDEYAIAYDKALTMRADMLEDAAFQRAVNGYERKVFYKGVLVDTEIVYSDQLLITLLKAAKPDVYKDRVTSENINTDGSSCVIRWAKGDENGEKDK